MGGGELYRTARDCGDNHRLKAERIHLQLQGQCGAGATAHGVMGTAGSQALMHTVFLLRQHTCDDLLFITHECLVDLAHHACTGNLMQAVVFTVALQVGVAKLNL